MAPSFSYQDPEFSWYWVYTEATHDLPHQRCYPSLVGTLRMVIHNSTIQLIPTELFACTSDM